MQIEQHEIEILEQAFEIIKRVMKKVRKPKKTEKVYHPKTNEMIDLFQHLNPEYETFFKVPKQRQAISDMLEKYGEEKVKGMIVYCQIYNADPKKKEAIGTPCQLRAFLFDIVAHYNKQANKPSKLLS